MTLTHPEAVGTVALLWLALAAAVGLGRLVAGKRLRRLLGRRVRPGVRGDVLLLLAAACVALAWLGPQAGSRTVRVPASGIDVVLLVDVSRSMDARDVAPSRLARARRAATEVLEGLRGGDRVALAAFAGRGALLAPLTPDKRALAEMVAALDTDLMSDAGSDAAAGLARALDAFEAESLRPRVLLVLSDGESPTLAEAGGGARAAESGVRVVSALFGREAGAPIPVGPGLLRHPDGEPVETRRERSAAEALAARTDGRVLLADDFGEVPRERLLEALRAGAVPTAEGTLEREVPVGRFAWPALVALALLLAEARTPRPRGTPAHGPALAHTLAHTVARRGRRRAAGAAVAGAALLALGAAPEGSAGRAPGAGSAADSTSNAEPTASAAPSAEPGADSTPSTEATAGPDASGEGSAGTPSGRAPQPSRRPTLEDARAVQRAAGQAEASDEARARRAQREAAVRAAPDDAGRLVALGVARAREGDLAGARRTFEAAALRAREPGLAATAYYDLGVAAVAGGELEAARDAFFDALAFAPSDAEARRHLEWTLQELAREEPPPGPTPSRPERDEAEQSPDAERSEEDADGGGPDGQAEAEEPAENGDEARDARPEPGAGAGDERAQARRRDSAPPPLDAAEAERWLEAVEDDPGRALRAAAGEEGAQRGAPGPRW